MFATLEPWHTLLAVPMAGISASFILLGDAILHWLGEL